MREDPRTFDDRYRELLIHSRVDAAEALEEVSNWWKQEWRRLGVEDRARLRRLRAHCLHTLSRMEAARREYAAAFAIFEEKELPAEMAKTAIGWIDCLAHLGRLFEARALAHRAESLIPRNDPAGRARLRANFANVLYLSGSVAQAEALYRSAVASLERVGNQRDAALCRFNLGQVLLARGKATAAVKVFQRSREVFIESGFTGSALQAACGAATARLLSGEWVEGFEDLNALLDELHQRGDLRTTAAVQWELSRFLGALGNFEAAEEEADKALRVHRELGLVREVALLSSLRARWLLALGRRIDARVLLERALESWKAMRRRRPARRVELELARVLLEGGEAAKALKRLSRLQRSFEAHDPAAVICRQLRSRAHLRLGHGRRAAKMADEAYHAARDPLLSWERPAMALDCAAGWLAAGEKTRSRHWLRRFAREFEALQSRLGSRVLRRLRAGASEHLLKEAVELALRADGSSRLAFSLVTRLSSRGFLEELSRGGFLLAPELRTSLALLRDRLLGAEGDDPEGDLRSMGLRVRLGELQKEIFPSPRIPGEFTQKVSAFGKSANAEGRRASFASPGDGINAPWAGHPRVLFYRERENWAAYCESAPGRIRRVPLPALDEVLQRAWIPLRLLLENAAGRPARRRRLFLKRTTTEAQQALSELRRALWEPIGLRPSRVEVIPHGILHELPLEALINTSSPGDGDDSPVVVYRRPHAGWNPRFPRRVRKALMLYDGRAAGERELRELTDILRNAGWEVHRGRRKSALRAVGKRQGLLHLAAHGVHHRSAWFLNGIHLEDGWLGFELIPERVVDGGMVYLDSCESGLGLEGEGVEAMGWVAAGLGAGAREMVLTLWKIDDESARIFAAASIVPSHGKAMRRQPCGMRRRLCVHVIRIPSTGPRSR